MSDLSLYHIDRGLAELLAFRSESLRDTDFPAKPEEIEAIDGEIRKYLEQLPAKVDGVAAILLKMKSRSQQITAEIDRLKVLKAHADSDEDRLKAYVVEILEKQPEPKKGPKKLVGSISELRLVGNGGVAPLEIPNPELVPDEYRLVTIVLPVAVFKAMQIPIEATVKGAEISNTLVRKGIEDHGGVPGAVLGERGKRVEVR